MLPLVEENGPCPVCGSDKLRPLHVYRSKRRVTTLPFLALTGCEACGMVHSSPLPSEAELAAYYEGPAGWEKNKRSEEDEDYEAVLAESLRRKAERYGGRLQLLRPHLAAADGSAEPRRAFDFGCGLGGWLDVLQGDGWETWGLEPGPKQARVAARRHTIVDEIPREERFDLVIVNHVLEHLRDPLSVMRDLAACVVPGGQIFVAVPDLGRLGRQHDFPYVASDVHIMSYTLAGLRSLLGLTGFQVETRFDGPEWDVPDKDDPKRMNVLARKQGEPGLPPHDGAPLAEAVESLRAHGRWVAEDSREEMRRKYARHEAAKRRARLPHRRVANFALRRAKTLARR